MKDHSENTFEDAKRSGHCIFCGSSGMSKEHLFSDWLRELFPRSAADTHTIGESRDGEPLRLRQRQNHSGSKKVRVVCKKCNNGWISIVDDAAKAVVLPLIRGEAAVVSSKTQHALALWFAKIAIVGDSRDRRGYISQSERATFMRQREPSALWEMWLASYEGTDYRDLALFQNGANLDALKLAAVGGPAVPVGYLQATTFGIGKLVALVIGNDIPQLRFSVGTFSPRARRIWPLGPSFNWPILPPLNDSETKSVTHIVEQMRMTLR
jgi:hypothetical protein